MKNNSILLILLFGLVPYVAQAAEFAGFAKGAFKGLEDSEGTAIEDSMASAMKELTDVGMDGAKAKVAVEDLVKSTQADFDGIAGTLKNLTARDAKLVEAQFADELKTSLKNFAQRAKTGDVLEDGKLTVSSEDFAADFGADFSRSLDGLNLTPDEISALKNSLSEATKENANLIAAKLPEKPVLEETPAQQLDANAAALEKTAQDAKQVLGPQQSELEAAQEKAVNSGQESGMEAETSGTEEAAVSKMEKQSKWFNFGERWTSSKKLTGYIKNAEEEKGALEAQLKDNGVVVDKGNPATGQPGSVTLTNECFDRQTATLTKEQEEGLNTFLDGKASIELKSDHGYVEARQEDVDGSKRLVVRFKLPNGQKITYNLKPTDVDDLFKGDVLDGTFTLSADGKISFKTENSGTVSFAAKGIDEKVSRVEHLKEQITRFKADRDKQEYFFQQAARASGQGFDRLGTILREEKWATTKTLAKKAGSVVVSGVKKGVGAIFEITKMMMTGIFFGVPSMIYQTLMQNAQAQALYEEVTSVYHITPNLAVQIPASLVPKNNAAQVGTYLYVAVDPASSGYGNFMSNEQLKNGSYYVVYQSGAQWGSTYATSPNAFGVWVNLNKTGKIFMDGGVPYSEQTPFAYLLEPSNDATIQATKGATTLSVEAYMRESYSSLGPVPDYHYGEGFLDSIAPWGIAPSNSTMTPNSTIQDLFAPVESSSSVGKSTIRQAGTAAPALLVPSLNVFRNGIKNVAGFLPSTKQTAVPAISIKQLTGIGVLNNLLGAPNGSTNPVEQAFNMVLYLSQTTGKGVSPLQAVTNAQAALAKALSDATPSDYGTKVAAATVALKDANASLQAAINQNIASVGGGTVSGLDSSIDVNAFNLYLYETADTPIAQFIAQNSPSSIIPAKDYVVLLDANGNVVPLFATALITRADGVGVIDFDTSQINYPTIQYMASLVSGVVYQYNANGAGKVVTTLSTASGSQSASSYLAQTVMPNLFQAMTQVLSPSDATDLMNQILSMANYATNLAYQGPVIKNGACFTRVSFDESYAATVQDKVNSIIQGINGFPLPPAQTNNPDEPFGPASPLTQQVLSELYVYKVSKAPTAPAQPGQTVQVEGIFGQDANGNQVYDYVVALAPVQLAAPGGAGTSSYYQIMPLGIADAAGSGSGLTGVQFMVSLVTGQVYDSNYCLFSNPPSYATIVMRDPENFQPYVQGTVGFPSGAYTTQYTPPGATTPETVAAIPNVSIATAFMPTFCNPYNVIFNDSAHTSSQAALNAAQAQVTAAVQAVTNLMKQVPPARAQIAATVWFDLQSQYAQAGQAAAQNLFREISSSPGYVAYLTLPTDQRGQQGALLTAMSSWITAKAAVATAQQAAAQQQEQLKKNLKPPFNAIPKAEAQMLIMAPMYWMHYTQFAYAPSSSQTVTYTNPSQQSVSANINWINTTPSSSAVPIGAALGQALPLSFIDEVIDSYNGWQQIMNSTDAVSQVMQAGPFQFTQNLKYNMYLTLPPSLGTKSVQNGNFFYNLSPVFPSTSLFVLGDLDQTSVNAIATALGALQTAATGTLSYSALGLSAPLTVSHFSSLGESFLSMTNPAAIDLSSGAVWLPTPEGYASLCYENGANPQCNLINIGTLNAQEVLDTVLATQQQQPQGTDRAVLLQTVQKENPSLYSMLMNCQALASQQAQLALSPFYFAGQLLSLCQEEITNGTYIYAVGVTPEDYYTATDYWVATDSNYKANGVLTPQTNYMVSLVTGNVYQMNVSAAQNGGNAVQQTTQSTATLSGPPLQTFQTFFGAGAYAGSTPLSSVASNNPTLYNRIQTLNNAANVAYVKQQTSQTSEESALVSNFPLAALQTAQPVNAALQPHLYQVNGQYYLALPGTGDAPSYYYQFNAGTGTNQYGVYYLIEGTGSSAAVSVVSTLAGYAYQAMLMTYGIAIDPATGNQTMGLPVYNPPLPMSAVDAKLQPGQSGNFANGDNMQCLSSPTTVAANKAINDTYAYYQYKNTASDSYLTRCVLNSTIPGWNAVTNSVTMLSNNLDYYVDLITGQCYLPDGTPQLAQVGLAYYMGSSATASTGIVANSALDFSNPLFIWGELDILGNASQISMMYQDVNAGDPANGYNFYQLPTGTSAAFTVYDSASQGQTVYAYGTDTDDDGNLLVTANGTTLSPQQTSLSAALVAALNGGGSLLSKQYTMTINGVAPSATAAAGSQVTVTETFGPQKQYMVSYTNAGGTLTSDMFQVPLKSGVGTAPGASVIPPATPSTKPAPNYNNPPLDAPFQAELLQGVPFCARVFASCPYGQEQVQNMNTSSLGTTAVTCGLLYQPATSSTFSVPSAGLLSAIFSGANPNGSTGSTNGQYFAFYDSYNNAGPGGSSSNVVPQKGQYGTYTSIVSSMNTPTPPACPGLYAGNFNVELSSATKATSFGAPYLRITPITGALTNYSGTFLPPTNYAIPPTSGTEYFYKYTYNVASNAQLNQLKARVNVSGNVAGFMQLVSALEAGTALTQPTVTNASINEAAAAVIQSQVFYGTPSQALAQEPTGRYLYQLQCGSGGADANSNAPTNQLCAMFFPNGGTTPATYVDIYNGIVFQAQSTSDGDQILYPVGFNVSHDLTNAIQQTIGGALPAKTGTGLTIQTPVAGSGVPVPGQMMVGSKIAPVQGGTA